MHPLSQDLFSARVRRTDVTQADPRFYSTRPRFFPLLSISSNNHLTTSISTEQATKRKMSQYTCNNSTGCQNTTNSYNTVNNYTVADDRSQLLAWLSPLDPRLRHCDIRERRVNDVGEWLIQTEKFRRWCGLGGEEGDEAVLFCYRNPGVGKTFIRYHNKEYSLCRYGRKAVLTAIIVRWW